jgi:hypothetical protein
MKKVTTANAQLTHPQSVRAFRAIKVLVGAYLAVSLAAIVVLGVLHDHPAVATQDAWVHGVIVAATALLMTSFAIRATRGSSNGYLRLRIASAIMLAAIIVIIAIPGDFPLWMKLEQGVCGLLLLGVVAIVNGKHLRSVFASRR